MVDRQLIRRLNVLIEKVQSNFERFLVIVSDFSNGNITSHEPAVLHLWILNGLYFVSEILSQGCDQISVGLESCSVVSCRKVQLWHMHLGQCCRSILSDHREDLERRVRMHNRFEFWVQD